jgi:hypothetical protein
MDQMSYPRPGHPIAPKILAAFLRMPVEIPREFSGSSQSRRLMLGQLDAKTWNRFPENVCREWAEKVVWEVGRVARSSKGFADLRIPPIPDGLTLADLEIDGRTRNALAAAGYDLRPQDLGKLTAEGVLGLPGFWVRSLVDLLTALEHAKKCPPPVEDRAEYDGRAPKNRRRASQKLHRGLTDQAAALGKIAGIRQISFNDPRLGGLLRTMDSDSDTIGEMVDRLRHRRADPPDPKRLADRLKLLRQTLLKMDRLPVEAELMEIFAIAEDDRDRKIVAQHFGWEGKKRRTLDSLGKEYGLTRERIRQICARVIKRHRNTEIYAPVLDRVLAFCAKQTPIGLTALQKEFDASGLTACGVHVGAIFFSARYFGRKLPFSIIPVDRKARMALAPGDVKLAKAILRAGRRAAAYYGSSTAAEVLKELPAKLRSGIPPKLLQAALQAITGFRWLDSRRQWFLLESSTSGYGLLNMIDKIFSVCPRIHIDQMHAALLRNRRSRCPLPPPNVLLEFCRRLPSVHVRGKYVAAVEPRDCRNTLPTAERMMVEVLKRHGPILDRKRLWELCSKEGMNQFSFSAVLMASPVVVQHRRCVYGLLTSH